MFDGFFMFVLPIEENVDESQTVMMFFLFFTKHSYETIVVESDDSSRQCDCTFVSLLPGTKIASQITVVYFTMFRNFH